MTRAISKRLARIAESPTLRVDAAAKHLAAEGRQVIGFGAGEPDFPTPAHIVEAAVQACRDTSAHRYSPTAGLPPLREAIAARTGGDAWSPGAERVLVTNGGKQAIYNACAAMVDPGDEVLIPTPYWPTFVEAVRLAGGVPVPVPTDASGGYRVGVAHLEQARTPRTKMLILVNPSNPTGAVIAADQLREIGAWVARTGLSVLTDEMYADLVYDDLDVRSLPAVCPELREQCVVVGGVAKSFAMTGWRVGWMVGPSAVVTAATNLQSHLTSNVCNVAQRAALAALTGPMEPVVEMRETFDRRRRTMVRLLNQIEGVECPLPGGAFYAFPSVEGLLGQGNSGRVVATSAELAAHVLEQVEVAVVPGEAFGSPGHLRLSYALSDSAMEEGLARLKDLFG